MCDTIQQLDKKNDDAHKKLHNEISSMKKDMATKDDVNKLKPEISKNSAISGTYKTWITILLGILALMATLTAVFMGFSYSDSHKSMDEQIQLNKILTSINQRIEESNAVAKNFNAKVIMDSITIHWNKEAKFYQDEYIKQKKWTHDVAIKTIYPTEVRSKRNEMVLKDHENRIGKLEEITGIKKKSQ